MGITDFSFFHLFIHLIFAKKVKMGKRVFFFSVECNENVRIF